MKLNNKGVTLIEIIISVVLIAIVLIFLATLLVTVNDINKESEVNSTYLINKSLILKNIESDLRKVKSLNISSCSIDKIYSAYADTAFTNNLKGKFCYEFKGSGLNSYLGIYYHDKKGSYVISYINKTDDIRVTKELPKFSEFNVKDDGTLSDVIFKPDLPSEGFFTMTIPIMGDDGKDYSIIISYYGEISI